MYSYRWLRRPEIAGVVDGVSHSAGRRMTPFFLFQGIRQRYGHRVSGWC